MQFREYTHPDDVEQNLVLFHEIMDGTRDAYQYEKRCFRKDGSLIWIRADVGGRGRRRRQPRLLDHDVRGHHRAQARRADAARAGEAERASGAARRAHRAREPPQAVRRRRARAERRRGDATFAIGIFDLDGFKAYNDVFGHPAGDTLLARLGRRLSDAVGGRGTAYRMGGDEFCVFTWAERADALIEAARVALCDQGDGFAIRCSCGVGAAARRRRRRSTARSSSPTSGSTATSAPTG